MADKRKHGESWDGSSTTPGWSDVMLMWAAITEAHGGECRLEMRLNAKPYRSIDMRLEWRRAYLPAVGEDAQNAFHYAAVEHRFPTAAHETLTGLVLVLSHRLDYVIGSTYEQTRLFPEGE